MRDVRRTSKGPMTAIVLVENEVTVGGRHDHWEDVTGERYQFPNQYRNKVITGRPFVYYRGVRRTGGVRGPVEYFGCGVVGLSRPRILMDTSLEEMMLLQGGGREKAQATEESSWARGGVRGR